MAADPKKASNDKKAEQAPDAAVDDGSKKKKKLFLLIGLAVGLMAISVGGTVLALKMLAPPTEEAEAVEEKATVLAPAIYKLMSPNFTINFNVNGRQRYLQAELTLMYRDAAVEPLLNLHMPAIRNGLVMLLSSKNFDELQTPEGKEKLRSEALSVVQNLLIKEQEALASANKEDDEDEDEKNSKDAKKAPGYPSIEQVLFTNFVMQ